MARGSIDDGRAANSYLNLVVGRYEIDTNGVFPLEKIPLNYEEAKAAIVRVLLLLY